MRHVSKIILISLNNNLSNKFYCDCKRTKLENRNSLIKKMGSILMEIQIQTTKMLKPPKKTSILIKTKVSSLHLVSKSCVNKL